jgi:hypothetical protein
MFKENRFAPGPLGFSLTKPFKLCPCGTVSLSLDIVKTPLAFLFLIPSSFPVGTVTAERKKGGAAYRRRERSGGGSGKVREFLAVTSRSGLPAVMVGIGLAACTGGRARRRRVLQPTHGGIV